MRLWPIKFVSVNVLSQIVEVLKAEKGSSIPYNNSKYNNNENGLFVHFSTK